MRRFDKPLTEDIVVVRGAGDIATGVIQKFVRAGMRVVAIETAKPTTVRRTVALSEAVYDGAASVEDLRACLVESADRFEEVWRDGGIPILIDPACEQLRAIAPDGVIDAILAKRNLGLHSGVAPIVVALGPGFQAPVDAHAVIETMRGHALGRVYFTGGALPNTGIPGVIGGRGAERVLRAPADGVVSHARRIGDRVSAGEVVFAVGGVEVRAAFDGILRGLIHEGLTVASGLKCGDIDPRSDTDCNTISDKARSVGGAALEAYLALRARLR